MRLCTPSLTVRAGATDGRRTHTLSMRASRASTIAAWRLASLTAAYCGTSRCPEITISQIQVKKINGRLAHANPPPWIDQLRETLRETWRRRTASASRFSALGDLDLVAIDSQLTWYGATCDDSALCHPGLTQAAVSSQMVALPTVVFLAFLCYKLRKSVGKLRRSRSAIMTTYYSFLWLLVVFNLLRALCVSLFHCGATPSEQ